MFSRVGTCDSLSPQMKNTDGNCEFQNFHRMFLGDGIEATNDPLKILLLLRSVCSYQFPVFIFNATKCNPTSGGAAMDSQLPALHRWQLTVVLQFTSETLSATQV